MKNANMRALTFSQRRAKIHTVDDIDNQLRLARQQLARIKRWVKSADLLCEKLERNEQLKIAQQTLRELRRKSFDIEDELKLSNHAQNIEGAAHV